MIKRGTFTLLLGVLFLFLLYLPINIPQSRLYSFKTPVDDYIPLITLFMAAYISYGLFLVTVFVYFFLKSNQIILNSILLGVIIACSFSYLIYLSFQSVIDRPIIYPINFFDRLYLNGNDLVAPYNAFPSLHVAISTICSIGFWQSKSRWSIPILIWAILIIASTVLTKQHYFLDVLSGLALGLGSFKLSERLLNKYLP